VAEISWLCDARPRSASRLNPKPGETEVGRQTPGDVLHALRMIAGSSANELFAIAQR
jgi:hypothetical protein